MCTLFPTEMSYGSLNPMVTLMSLLEVVCKVQLKLIMSLVSDSASSRSRALASMYGTTVTSNSYEGSFNLEKFIGTENYK